MACFHFSPQQAIFFLTLGLHILQFPIHIIIHLNSIVLCLDVWLVVLVLLILLFPSLVGIFQLIL